MRLQICQFILGLIWASLVVTLYISHWVDRSLALGSYALSISDHNVWSGHHLCNFPLHSLSRWCSIRTYNGAVKDSHNPMDALKDEDNSSTSKSLHVVLSSLQSFQSTLHVNVTGLLMDQMNIICFLIIWLIFSNKYYISNFQITTNIKRSIIEYSFGCWQRYWEH